MGDKTKRLVLVVSGKGGVGKTTFSRLMTDVYRERNTKAAIFDADGQIGGLVRVYHDAGVAFYDLRQDAERVTLLNSIASDADVILHDLPAVVRASRSARSWTTATGNRSRGSSRPSRRTTFV